MKLIALCLLITAVLPGQSSTNLFRVASPSIYFVETDIKAGTGFCVSSSGLVATSLHVVDGAKSIRLNQNQSHIMDSQASLASIDPIHDLALLQLSGHHCTPLRLGNSNSLEPGQRIFVIGNPLGNRALTSSMSDGLISGIRADESHGKVIQISAPISHGNSGGPVLDERGTVIGIVDFKLDGELLNFAIPSSELIKLLARPRSVVPSLESVSIGSHSKSVPALPDIVESIFSAAEKASGTCSMKDASWTENKYLRDGRVVLYKNWQRSDLASLFSYEAHKKTGEPVLVISGKNKDGTWTKVGTKLRTKPLEPEDIENHLVDNWYAFCPGVKSLWRDINVSDDTTLGVPAHKVRVTEPFFGATITFWFSKNSHLLIAREYLEKSASGATLTRDVYRDFRQIENVTIPFSQTTTFDGENPTYRSVISFQPNPGLPDYLFALPQLPPG